MLSKSQIITYILEAATIALVSRYFLGRAALDRGLFVLIISIAVSHIVVDLFAPEVGIYMRQGAGFGIGRGLSGNGSGQQGGSMGLQTALGTQRTLQKGGGLQSALGTQRTLRNEAAPAAQVNIIERFMSDREALDYYKEDRSTNDRKEPGEIHEQFIGNLITDNVQVMPYDSDETLGLDSRGQSSLHSEDLISISSGEYRLALLEGSNYIQAVPKTQSGINDMLFKLRFKALTGGKGQIKYGDSVLLQYNDDASQTKTINHDGHLNVLENNRDIVFQLYCKDYGDHHLDAVDTADQIIIRCGGRGLLKIDGDRVSTTAYGHEATVFDISPVRGF